MSDIVDKLKRNNGPHVTNPSKDVVGRLTDYLKSGPSNPIPLDGMDDVRDTSEWLTDNPYIDKFDS